MHVLLADISDRRLDEVAAHKSTVTSVQTTGEYKFIQVALFCTCINYYIVTLTNEIHMSFVNAGT